MARPKTDAKQVLLDAAVRHVAAHGVGELSLRQLAEAIGSSHRMLIFHFGSKDALLAEIVATVERQQREYVLALADDDTGTAVEHIWQIWKRVSSKELEGATRLFFELSGQALQGQTHAVPFLDTLTDPWLASIITMLKRGGAPSRTAKKDARIALATVRGLLLDRIASGDKRGTDQAMARFLDYLTLSWTDQQHRSDAEPRPARPTRKS